MKARLSPFLVLLEARYLPLLLLAIPQALAVGYWLFTSNKPKLGDWGATFAGVIGALAFEFTFVGAIAWAEGKVKGLWVWLTATTALIFSIGIALVVYWDDKNLYSTVLHIGFPLVAFVYTMTSHFASGEKFNQFMESLHQKIKELQEQLHKQQTENTKHIDEVVNKWQAHFTQHMQGGQNFYNQKMTEKTKQYNDLANQYQHALDNHCQEVAELQQRITDLEHTPAPDKVVQFPADSGSEQPEMALIVADLQENDIIAKFNRNEITLNQASSMLGKDKSVISRKAKRARGD